MASVMTMEDVIFDIGVWRNGMREKKTKFRDTTIKLQYCNGYHDAGGQSWKGFHITEKESEGVTYQRPHNQLAGEDKFTDTLSVLFT